jgi:hypothetical protein
MCLTMTGWCSRLLMDLLLLLLLQWMVPEGVLILAVGSCLAAASAALGLVLPGGGL